MECPKCGSKLIKQVDQMTKKETGYWFCEEHKDLYPQKEVNEFYFYNRRLDRVLSEFRYFGGTYTLSIPYGINIMYGKTNKQFTLNGTNISLETVESLYNDLPGYRDLK